MSHTSISILWGNRKFALETEFKPPPAGASGAWIQIYTAHLAQPEPPTIARFWNDYQVSAQEQRKPKLLCASQSLLRYSREYPFLACCRTYTEKVEQFKWLALDLQVH